MLFNCLITNTLCDWHSVREGWEVGYKEGKKVVPCKWPNSSRNAKYFDFCKGKNGFDPRCQKSHDFVFHSSFYAFLNLSILFEHKKSILQDQPPARRLGKFRNIFPLFLIFFVCVLSSTWHNLLTYFLWRIERPNWIEIGYLYIDLLNTSHHLTSSLLQPSLLSSSQTMPAPTET